VWVFCSYLEDRLPLPWNKSALADLCYKLKIRQGLQIFDVIV
jgi:hypothetical protein